MEVLAMKSAKKKIFLITGAGAGFGRAFTEAALEAGHTVVGTVRREEQRIAFEALHGKRAHAVIIDVTHFDAIDPTVRKIEAHVGPIDVLVNNAGYGHEGILEESPLAELIHQFEVNVFGAVAMIKAVLPAMRRRRRGHIINITSMAGYISMPGIAYYSESKFALEGITEALAQEVKGLGIKVTAIAPGSFRTEWAGPLRALCFRLRHRLRPGTQAPPGKQRATGRGPGQGRPGAARDRGVRRATDAPAARQGCPEAGQGAARRAPRRNPGLGARFALDRLPRDGKAGCWRPLRTSS
jgi:NAD(P)-dependent dehydrogenase (short-subunit alcohol dehydrogenase family)